MAVGDRTAVAIDHTYTAPAYLSQHPWDHVEGTPYGTRGGMVVDHVFPADGEYVFEVAINGGGSARYEDIDISIDGERVALLSYEDIPAGGADGRGALRHHDRADRDQGGAAQGCGGVRAADRGALRRSDSPARLVVCRRRLGRRRDHRCCRTCATSSSAARTRPAACRERRAATRCSRAVRRRRTKSCGARGRSSRGWPAKRIGVRLRCAKSTR